jgi:hypothetical protein
MPYIGRPLNAGNLAVQSGTGDGSDTTPIATLDYSVGSSNSIGVYLDGVRQLAGTDFTASGTVLTFTTAPANLVGIDVYFLGLELSIPTPADATVTAAKLASNAVTTAKIIANAVDETKLKDALVADFTEVVVTASDSILLGDATDSGNTKRDTVQGILDLAAPIFANSSVHLHTLNGYGSSSNKIRRWTSIITNTGSDITYADSASLGATFTINTDGIYSISYADEFNASSWLGLSLNSNQLTTVIYSITDADALIIKNTAAANNVGVVSLVIPLSAADVIRCHTKGDASGAASTQPRFIITRVG